ncbi:gem-associated protein 6 [Betta splendens]|uniref:Gem-associated protein 6 n=1 Tax=Betta splendens TaxID=158456 RepID=A0A9W2Y9J4_BETSP|nr:gem-associated protein 6 [Betta splendens]
MQCGWSLLGPLEWVHYVNKQVKVKAGNGEELRGWLFTVDPVSASLVLVDFRQNGGSLVQVVLGHAVEEVQILQKADKESAAYLCTLFKPSKNCRLDPEELRRKKRSIQNWLEKNQIPVVAEGAELRVAGVLTIRAPYRPEDCCSSNQIILDRIQRLMQNQPDHPGPPPETEPGLIPASTALTS